MAPTHGTPLHHEAERCHSTESARVNVAELGSPITRHLHVLDRNMRPHIAQPTCKRESPHKCTPASRSSTFTTPESVLLRSKSVHLQGKDHRPRIALIMLVRRSSYMHLLFTSSPHMRALTSSHCSGRTSLILVPLIQRAVYEPIQKSDVLRPS